MAEFSKQWCEKYDPEMPWDFDITEIADDLPDEHYTPVICEGYGFTAIGKIDGGQVKAFLPQVDEWVLVSELDNYY